MKAVPQDTRRGFNLKFFCLAAHPWSARRSAVRRHARRAAAAAAQAPASGLLDVRPDASFKSTAQARVFSLDTLAPLAQRASIARALLALMQTAVASAARSVGADGHLSSSKAPPAAGPPAATLPAGAAARETTPRRLAGVLDGARFSQRELPIAAAGAAAAVLRVNSRAALGIKGGAALDGPIAAAPVPVRRKPASRK